jgi:hypothetical protein
MLEHSQDTHKQVNNKQPCEAHIGYKIVSVDETIAEDAVAAVVPLCETNSHRLTLVPNNCSGRARLPRSDKCTNISKSQAHYA